MVTNSTTIPVLPLEITYLAPQAEYTAITGLQVGQSGLIIAANVQNLTDQPVAATMVIEDIRQDGITDSIQFQNVTINGLGEIGTGVRWVIETPGNHTLVALALSPDQIPSMLAAKVAENAIVEERQ